MQTLISKKKYFTEIKTFFLPEDEVFFLVGKSLSLTPHNFNLGGTGGAEMCEIILINKEKDLFGVHTHTHRVNHACKSANIFLTFL